MLDTPNHGSEPKTALAHEIAGAEHTRNVKIIKGTRTHYQCFSCPPRQLVEHALGKRMLVGSAGGFCRIKKMHKRSHSHTTTRAYCLDVGLL